MNIGREEREIIVEPITIPVPAATPDPTPIDPDRTPVPVGVPDKEDIHAPA